jgi:hypothetical protein
MHLKEIGVAEVPVLKDCQAVAARKQVGTFGDADDRPGGGAVKEHVADLFALLDAVDLVEGVVEDEQAGAGDDGAGDHETAGLDPGEGAAAGMELGVHALREELDLIEETDAVEQITGVVVTEGKAHAQVVEQGAGEDFDVADEGDVAAEFVEGQVPEIDVVHGDDARIGLPEAVEQVGEGGFTAAIVAHQAQPLAGGQLEIVHRKVLVT